MEDPGPGEPNMLCEDVSISYANDILPIINSTCALSDCHVFGFEHGDYTTYFGLKAKVDNGTLVTQVVSGRTMPPADSPGPTLLSNEQIQAFLCWINEGGLDN